jgi:hypothetical protein
VPLNHRDGCDRRREGRGYGDFGPRAAGSVRPPTAIPLNHRPRNDRGGRSRVEIYRGRLLRAIGHLRLRFRDLHLRSAMVRGRASIDVCMHIERSFRPMSTAG